MENRHMDTDRQTDRKGEERRGGKVDTQRKNGTDRAAAHAELPPFIAYLMLNAHQTLAVDANKCFF